ncbi:MAG: nickel-dependent lactate racemase [Candidatus Thermoplasmatota archaeon]
MEISLPYGKRYLSVDVPDSNLIEVVLPREFISPEKPEIIVQQAVLHPVGTQRLSELSEPGDTVAVVVDDYTRPCPTHYLLPPILEELHDAGVDDADVTIIVACGTHQPPSFEQIKQIVGDKVSRNYRVTSNDVTHGEYVSVGMSKRGNNIELLQDYVMSDIKVLLGDIEYHYFAGYGGTRKSILPGLASRQTIQRNHSMMFEPYACMGVLRENPIHQEMIEAMHLGGCDFALNVVQNSQHKIVGAWAGKPELVMDLGVKLVDSMYHRQIQEQPDIIITAANGHPHDINLYQAMKAMYTACQIIHKNGVVILVAECPQGIGSTLYEDWMKRYRTSDEIRQALESQFILGAHKAYYHRKAIENHQVFFVSSMDPAVVKNLFSFDPVTNLDEALRRAFEVKGKDARVLVVPQGTTSFLGKKCTDH